MKVWLGLLFMLGASTTVTARETIKGTIKDENLCGGVLLETVCSFEVPDFNRRRRRRLGGGANKGGGGGPGTRVGDLNQVVNVITSCQVQLDGVQVDSSVTALEFSELVFDETVKGDDTKLLVFANKINLADSDVTGLVKLEAFEYDDSSNLPTTTLKTFSIAWSGC